MRLTSDKILLKSKQEKTSGGIFMPETAKGKRTYEVAAVGPGHWNPYTCSLAPMPVKVGDKVVADVQMAPEIEIAKNGEKQKYYIIGENEILYILDEGEVDK